MLLLVCSSSLSIFPIFTKKASKSIRMESRQGQSSYKFVQGVLQRLFPLSVPIEAILKLDSLVTITTSSTFCSRLLHCSPLKPFQTRLSSTTMSSNQFLPQLCITLKFYNPFFLFSAYVLKQLGKTLGAVSYPVGFFFLN